MTDGSQHIGLNRRTVLKSLGAGGAASLLAGCSGGGGGGGGEIGDTLTIGLLAPLSGAYGFAGEFQRQGMELAFEELNSSDEVFPDTTLELVRGDTETDPDTGLSEARRLYQQEDIDVFAGCTSSSVASVVSEYANNNNIIFSMIQSADRALTSGENCRASSYRPNPHTHQAGRLAGNWCTDQFGERAFILHQDYSYGTATRDAVEQGISEAGGTVVDTAAVPLGNQQFQSVIDRIESTDIDWLLFGITGSGSTAFLTQAANRGLDIPMGNQSLPSYATGEVGPDIINQFSELYRTPALYTREIDTQRNSEHVSAFEEMHGHPPNYSSETGYMVGRFLGEGLHEAGTLDVEEARSTLEGFTVESARGSNTIRECDHQGTPPLYIAKVTGVDEEVGLGTHEIVDQFDSAEYTDSCSDIECQL
ncbi:ABC transporter substrate-binding protein [Halorientalis marina]|uniref:ABC transporter substrate-binding protein n=1 Tax=Halorientalis marina TaxID=2931976 RepID=UPI001FF41162|nr:ABC transporter substrate-binding protein [Halorientalis marina]